jgi:hypothetical protein
LRNAFDHIHQDDVCEFLFDQAQCAIGADVACTHNRHFLSQENGSFEMEKRKNDYISHWRFTRASQAKRH